VSVPAVVRTSSANARVQSQAAARSATSADSLWPGPGLALNHRKLTLAGRARASKVSSLALFRIVAPGQELKFAASRYAASHRAVPEAAATRRSRLKHAAAFVVRGNPEPCFFLLCVNAARSVNGPADGLLRANRCCTSAPTRSGPPPFLVETNNQNLGLGQVRWTCRNAAAEYPYTPSTVAGRAGLSAGVEDLFASALVLRRPRGVENVKLDVPAQSIDFEVGRSAAPLNYPACQQGSVRLPAASGLTRMRIASFELRAALALHSQSPFSPVTECLRIALSLL